MPDAGVPSTMLAPVSIPLLQLSPVGGDLVGLLIATGLGAALGATGLRWWYRRWLAARVETLQRRLVARLDEAQRPRETVSLHEPLVGLRAQIEQLLQASEEQRRLAEAERDHLHQILQHLSDGIVTIDAHGTVRFVNTAACSLLSTTRERALSRPAPEVLRDYELHELVRAAGEGATPPSRFVELGRPRRTVQALASSQLGPSGRTVTLILRDITELRRTETIRRDFVANVSHDLRTPLAGLQALVETLLDGALEDRAVARDFLHRIAVEVDHLARLVEQLLQLTRAEAGQLPLHPRPTDLAALIDRELARFEPRAHAKQLELIRNVSPELPSVVCDPERIGQVLANLLDNAIKFTPPGGRITVHAEATSDGVRVAVSDTGPGIPSDDLDRVFERFYKGDRSRSAMGSGLGLAIVKHLVQLHGGTVWAESPPRAGATVGFAIPLDFTAGSQLRHTESLS
jgi:two-component system phosphate regulon sensor histidine kinase PhoR